MDGFNSESLVPCKTHLAIFLLNLLSFCSVLKSPGQLVGVMLHISSAASWKCKTDFSSYFCQKVHVLPNWAILEPDFGMRRVKQLPHQQQLNIRYQHYVTYVKYSSHRQLGTAFDKECMMKSNDIIWDITKNVPIPILRPIWYQYWNFDFCPFQTLIFGKSDTLLVLLKMAYIWSSLKRLCFLLTM